MKKKTSRRQVRRMLIKDWTTKLKFFQKLPPHPEYVECIGICERMLKQVQDPKIIVGDLVFVHKVCEREVVKIHTEKENSLKAQKDEYERTDT